MRERHDRSRQILWADSSTHPNHRNYRLSNVYGKSVFIKNDNIVLLQMSLNRVPRTFCVKIVLLAVSDTKLFTFCVSDTKLFCWLFLTQNLI